MMKRFFQVVLVVVSLAVASVSIAEDKVLSFGWGYPDDEASLAVLNGFRLYQDGNVVIADNIPKDARSYDVTVKEDYKTHSYHIVALDYEGDESKASNAVNRAKFKISATTFLEVTGP